MSASEHQMLKAVLKDLLDDPAFRQQTVATATRVATRRRARTRIAIPAAAMLAVYIIGYITLHHSQTTPTSSKLADTIHTRSDLIHIEPTRANQAPIIHTRENSVTITSTADYPKRPEIISDQTLLALFADRAPRLERAPNRPPKLIFTQ